jgi:hypothetical protein
LAAGFSIDVANGVVDTLAPFPPVDVADPVAGVAGLVIRAELAFCGRIEEATARFEGVSHPHGALADFAGALDALILVLAGRLEEARPWAERAQSAAVVLGAKPAEMVASALLAEISGDRSLLPAASSRATSVADTVVLRGHAVLGDPDAGDAVRHAAKALAVPGLLSRL